MGKIPNKIKSFLPPVLTSRNGKTYACPGWIDITDGVLNMTLEQSHKEVMRRWEQILPKDIEEKPDYKIYEMVKSSKGDKEYDVTFDGMNWNCTCVGFGFRRDCKHCKIVKEKHGIKK